MINEEFTSNRNLPRLSKRQVQLSSIRKVQSQPKTIQLRRLSLKSSALPSHTLAKGTIRRTCFRLDRGEYHRTAQVQFQPQLQRPPLRSNSNHLHQRKDVRSISFDTVTSVPSKETPVTVDKNKNPNTVIVRHALSKVIHWQESERTRSSSDSTLSHRSEGPTGEDVTDKTNLQDTNASVGIWGSSCFIFSRHGTIRRFCIRTVQNGYFEAFIFTCIVVGAGIEGMTDYSPGAVDEYGEPSSKSWRNAIVYQTEPFFVVVYSIEFMLKVVAFGFIFGRDAYLKSGWNVVDFAAVVTSAYALLPWAGSSMKVFRMVRILRILLRMSTIPTLRKIVDALINSLPGLADVLMLLLFVIYLFSVLALQLWGISGITRTRCRSTPVPMKLNNLSEHCLGGDDFGIVDRESWTRTSSPWYTPQPCKWPVVRSSERACALAGEAGMYSCRSGEVCGLNWDRFGNPRFESDQVMRSDVEATDVNFIGYSGWDNIGQCAMTVFQVITLEGWSPIFYRLQDSFGGLGAGLFFIPLVLIGAFVVLNLALAVMEDQFGQTEHRNLENLATRLLLIEGKNGENFMSIASICKSLEVFKGTVYAGVSEQESLGLSTSFEIDATPADFERAAKKLNFDLHEPLSASCWSRIIGGMGLNVAVLEANIERIESKGLESEGNLYQSCSNFLCNIMVPMNKAGKKAAPWFTPALSKNLDRFIMVVIVINTVLIGMERYPQPTDEADIRERVAFACTCTFVLEMFLKLAGLGFALYIHDPYNCFDAFIVFLSILELIVAPPLFIARSAAQTSPAISSLRILRLLRLVKLLHNFPKTMKMLGVVLRLIPAVSNFACLVVLFIYVFALASMTMFANRFHFDDQGEVVDYGKEGFWEAEVPRQNFDNLGLASLTIFQILSGEDWPEFQVNCRRVLGVGGQIWIIIIVVLGQFLVLNLFLAMLCQTFDALQDEDADETSYTDESKNEVEATVATPRESRGNNSNQGSDDIAVVDDEHSEITDPDLAAPKSKEAPNTTTDSLERVEILRVAQTQTALFILPANLPVRMYLARIISSNGFDSCILFLITVSMVQLALDNPLNNPKSTLTNVLSIMDTVLLWIFVAEMLLKIMVMGFVAHKGAYLRNSWNQLDFFIVMTSILNAYSSTLLAGVGGSSLRVFRSLRALRPLRMIQRNKGMKVVVNALIASIPAVVAVCGICFFFFFVFAIIGVNLFKGRIFHCELPEDAVPGIRELVENPREYDDLSIQERAWGLDRYSGKTSKDVCEWLHGAAWTRPIPQHFDNVGNALVTLFEMSTTEGWVAIMTVTMDLTEVDMQPRQNANPLNCIFSVVFILFATFLLMNLFVGVLIDNFNEQQKEQGTDLLLTEDQQQWVNMQKMIIKTAKTGREPAPGFKNVCWHLASPEGGDLHQIFDTFIFICIVANTISLSVGRLGQPDTLKTVVTSINNGFSIVFILEAIIKIHGLQFKYYLKDGWNRFDLFLVFMSLVMMLSEVLNFYSGMGTAIYALRALRVARILKMIPRVKGLHTLATALYLTLPGLMNIFVLLLLIYMIFALWGMQLFATVAFYEEYSPKANFQSVQDGILVLLRCSTGEAWNSIMHALVRDGENCDPNPTYDISVCGFEGSDPRTCVPINGCGNSLAIPFFMLFTLIVSYVMVNLVIAVILDNFGNSLEASMGTEIVEARDGDIGLNLAEYQEFCEVWLRHDPHARLVIDGKNAMKILCKLSFGLHSGPGGWPTYDEAHITPFLERMGVLPVSAEGMNKHSLRAFHSSRKKSQELYQEELYSWESLCKGLGYFNALRALGIAMDDLIHDDGGPSFKQMFSDTWDDVTYALNYPKMSSEEYIQIAQDAKKFFRQRKLVKCTIIHIAQVAIVQASKPNEGNGALHESYKHVV